MSLFDDDVNLRLLHYLVSGEGVSVNINGLAKAIRIHRMTVKRKLKRLMDENIITSPFYPFQYIYKAYPTLILVKADMPRSKDVIDFFKDDSHIFAAFSCMEGAYNTFLIEYFKDLESYHAWREKIVTEYKIPSREHRSPADATIFTNTLMFKNDPNCLVNDVVQRNRTKDCSILNYKRFDQDESTMLSLLLRGEHIQRNDSYLSSELGLNRKTVKRRVKSLIEEGILGPPSCFFPNLFVPPGYNLVVSLVEVKSRVADIRKYIMNHHNISRAQEASTGRYNLLLFSAWGQIEDFFQMGEQLIDQFSGSIGAIENIFLSSHMTYTIKPQKISLAWIERKLWEHRFDAQLG
jgi:DNA-binding Lrp family transcriptional regulator